MFALLTLAAAQAAEPPPVPMCGVEVVREFPHDPTSFTQGLLIHDGLLYEGTGLAGQSRVAILDLATGKVRRQSPYPATQFGEGIARWKDQLISLTWRGGIGHRWRLKDLKPLGTIRYTGEGWGLTTLGDKLVMSDGSASLRFFDPATMKETGTVPVTIRGKPLARINELEAIDGQIWANVWFTEFIVRIDPASGKVVSVIDVRGLKQRAGAMGGDSVLNGIAWDAKARKLYVTGKYWPKLFEIRVTGCA
jgi:glutamine cyclotransferase